MGPFSSRDFKPFDPLDIGALPVSEAAQTFAAGLAQAQSEAAQLTCRRVRAWMELPQAMIACRTLPDVAETQARFVQTCWTDWLQASQRLATTWAKTMAAPMQAVAEAAPATRAPRATQEADPFAVWEWWRTDMKAIVPRRNEPASVSGVRSDTH